MKTAKSSSPVDVSKSLFMDLAFLLIASLVLLVNEPAQEEARKEAASIESERDAIMERVKQLELRPSAVKEVVETASGGESIFLKQTENGGVYEITAEGSDVLLDEQALMSRIDEMVRPRYAVLHVEESVPYDKFSNLRDRLHSLKADSVIDFCLEVTTL